MNVRAVRRYLKGVALVAMATLCLKLLADGVIGTVRSSWETCSLTHAHPMATDASPRLPGAVASPRDALTSSSESHHSKEAMQTGRNNKSEISHPVRRNYSSWGGLNTTQRELVESLQHNKQLQERIGRYQKQMRAGGVTDRGAAGGLTDRGAAGVAQPLTDSPGANVTLGQLVDLLNTTAVLNQSDQWTRLLSLGLGTEIVNSLEGMPGKYLGTFRNPCWRSRLPPAGTYTKHPSMSQVAIYPNLHREVVSHVLHKMDRVYSNRTKPDTAWRMRCLPYLYVIGVTKSGSSDLYGGLITHPDVVPGALKEPMFWPLQPPNHGFPHRLSQYLDLYDEAADNINRDKVVQDGVDFHEKITVDASPNQLWRYDSWRSMPGNQGQLEPKFVLAHTLRALVPQARIVTLLRHPVDRLYSQFRHKGSGSSAMFHRYCLKAIGDFRECVRRDSLRACAYNRSMDYPRKAPVIFLRVSIYSVLLRDWYDVFPRDQLHVMRAEDYYANRSASLTPVWDLLGLRHLTPQEDEQVNRGPVVNQFGSKKAQKINESMAMATRAMLEEFYAPFNKELAELLRDDRFLWRPIGGVRAVTNTTAHAAPVTADTAAI